MASKNTDHGSNPRNRFIDVISESRRMLPPIKGYEKMPLVSIDDAIEPVVAHVPEVKRMVYTVKPNCESPADGLTPDESAAIMLYTLEWTPTETSFYFILNQFLRAVDRARLKPWFLYLKLLIYSLSKLPSKPCHIFRGGKQDLHNNYPKDNIFVWWGFSSCTTAISTLSYPAFMGNVGPWTIFNIESYSGKDIRNHSMIPAENEILLLPGRQFKVLDTLNSGRGPYIVQVKEMEPQFPLLAPVSACSFLIIGRQRMSLMLAVE